MNMNPKQRVMEQLMACAILRASSKAEDDRVILPVAPEEIFLSEPELEMTGRMPAPMLN